MEPKAAPDSGVYRGLFSGCEARVGQGDPLPYGPGYEATWFVVHTVDESWMLIAGSAARGGSPSPKARIRGWPLPCPR